MFLLGNISENFVREFVLPYRQDFFFDSRMIDGIGVVKWELSRYGGFHGKKRQMAGALYIPAKGPLPHRIVTRNFFQSHYLCR